MATKYERRSTTGRSSHSSSPLGTRHFCCNSFPPTKSTTLSLRRSTIDENTAVPEYLPTRARMSHAQTKREENAAGHRDSQIPLWRSRNVPPQGIDDNCFGCTLPPRLPPNFAYQGRCEDFLDHV